MSTRRIRSISLTTMALSLVAMGALAGFGIPSFFARPDVTLHNACELVASEVRATQSRAAWLRRPLTLVVNENGYHATDAEGRRVRRQPGGRLLERSFRVAGVFEGVAFSKIDLGGDRELVFSDRGEPDAAGRLVLAFEGCECELRIAAETGRVTLHRDERGSTR